MEFFEKKIAGLPVFELRGKMMGDGECWALERRLKELINADEKNIVLDFSGVRWLNSVSIGLLLSCLKHIRGRGGELHFACTRGHVAYYLKITKLDTKLRIHQSIEDCVANTGFLIQDSA